MPWCRQVSPYGSGKNKMRNKIYSIFILSLYALVTIATSQKKEGLAAETHEYAITSNCSNASVTTGTISLSSGTISNTDFRVYGFPNEALVVGEDSTGELAPALTRTCIHSLDTSTPTVTISVYTCSDNSIPSCIINLTHLD